MLRSSSYIAVGVAVGLLVPCVIVEAQDVRAWETAVNYMQDDKGCYSIPYPDQQSSCLRKQNEVVKWCKESGPFNCTSVDPKQLQRQVEQLKTQRDELNSEKGRLEREKSNAKDDAAKQDVTTKIAKVDATIDTLNKTRASLEKEVLEGTRTCNERLAIAKACRDNRSAVQEVFSDVRSRADRESDPKITPLAKRLLDWWGPRYRSHEQEVTEVKRAVEACEQALYDIVRIGSF
jgi:DNA repair exonuclease SbcCD ATPase subunit